MSSGAWAEGTRTSSLLWLKTAEVSVHPHHLLKALFQISPPDSLKWSLVQLSVKTLIWLAPGSSLKSSETSSEAARKLSNQETVQPLYSIYALKLLLKSFNCSLFYLATFHFTTGCNWSVLYLHSILGVLYLHIITLDCFHFPAASLPPHRTAPVVQIIENMVVLSRSQNLGTNSIKANFLCFSSRELVFLCLAVAVSS